MPRLVRHAVPASLPVLLAIALVVIGPGASAGASSSAVQPLAAVDWPPSSGLLVGEVMTGGASASDEFVELYNAGAASIDLAGQEVVYVTSTGGTVTRKATWATTTLLEPGRHLLLANTSGVFAAMADATYSGGLAATGGTILVRPVGGAVIDADRLGRRLQCLRRGDGGAGASGRFEPRTTAGWHGRQSHRLEPEPGRLVTECRAGGAEPRLARCPRWLASDPDSDPGAYADDRADFAADACPDPDSDA